MSGFRLTLTTPRSMAHVHYPTAICDPDTLCADRACLQIEQISLVCSLQTLLCKKRSVLLGFKMVDNRIWTLAQR